MLKGKPLFAYTDAEVSEVIEGMVANYVDAIPILSRENHQVVGIVSYIDILPAILGEPRKLTRNSSC